MLATITPLKYNPNRKYWGKTDGLINLKCSLDSLIHQPVITEVFVVNYKPESLAVDPQIEYIKEIYRNVEKVKIINITHGDYLLNQSWLINMGLKAATSEFYMRADIDCILEPNFSEKFTSDLVQRLREKEYFIADVKDEWSREFDWFGFKKEDFYSMCETAPSRVNGNSHIICSLKTMKEIHGYDEHFQVWGGEDDDMNFRLQAFGIKATRYPFVFMHQPHTHFLDYNYTEQEILETDKRWERLQDKRIIKNLNGWGNLTGPMTNGG